MRTRAPLRAGGLTRYRVRFWVACGEGSRALTWERWGDTLEGTFDEAKEAIAAEYGARFRGHVGICGPQGESGVYAF